MKKLVVLISGNGTNLQSILNACKNGFIKGKIVAVFSNKLTAYGLNIARAEKIPTHTLSTNDFKDRKTFDRQLIKEIDVYIPDLVILAGYMLILGNEFVLHYHHRLMNIHPSLLPKYPGLHTHRQVLKNGDTEHGATVHFVTNKLDSGPIILQAKIPIFIGDTESDIIKRLQNQEHIIYPIAIRWFVEERLQILNDVVWLDGSYLLGQNYLNTDN